MQPRDPIALLQRAEIALTPIRTDEGHYLLDCQFPDGIADLDAVDGTLKRRPGVVETGLFLHMDPEVFVGRSRGA